MSRDSGKVMRRSIGIVFADGGLLTLSGTAPADGDGHGEEPLFAVLCDPDGAPVVFEEALLSTEYGEDGGAAAGDAGAVARHGGRPAAARRRHADQRGRPRRPTAWRRRSPSSAGRSRAARASAITRSPGPVAESGASARRQRPHRGGRLRLRRRPDHPADELVPGAAGRARHRPGGLRQSDARGGSRRRRREPALQARARRHHRTRIPRRPRATASRPPPATGPSCTASARSSSRRSTRTSR